MIINTVIQKFQTSLMVLPAQIKLKIIQITLNML